MKEIVRYSLVLGVICFISGTLLAVVNSAAQPKIALQKEEAEKLALKEVVPQADDFRPVKEGEKLLYYSAYNKSGKLMGFAIKTEATGYSSDIQALTGLGLDFNIICVKVLSQNETPGLGSRIEETSFLEQFKGKDLGSFDKIEAISGATISSSALMDSIKKKISETKDELQREIKNAK
ncbi:MAG: RnfABCDGE type electron transport complex subunit G [Candidatus Omnitrophica bacterium]|nr:RnfABCDGE type electron transport complex subunit G [Candidatus Omnitrophota bacterium]MBU1869271.1 RnfABCDGE type electron transport complex subunit G [Candidatus Omnitrophota bacterium]